MGGKIKNWKIAGEPGAELLPDFCLKHTYTAAYNIKCGDADGKIENAKR